MFQCDGTDNHYASGLPSAPPNQPPSHQDAHIWLPLSSTRSPSLLDRKRCRSIRPLHKLPSAQDGSVWRFHQRAIGPLLNQYTAEDVFRQDEFDGEDYADSRQQSGRTCAPSSVSALWAPRRADIKRIRRSHPSRIQSTSPPWPSSPVPGLSTRSERPSELASCLS